MSAKSAELFDLMTVCENRIIDQKRFLRFVEAIATDIRDGKDAPKLSELEMLLKDRCKWMSNGYLNFYMRLIPWLVLNALCIWGEEKKMPYCVAVSDGAKQNEE